MYWAWETTAMLCLLGGVQGAGAPTGTGAGHIVLPRAQLVLHCHRNWIWKTLLMDFFWPLEAHWQKHFSKMHLHFHMSLSPYGSLVTSVCIPTGTGVSWHLFTSQRESHGIHVVPMPMQLSPSAVPKAFLEWHYRVSTGLRWDGQWALKNGPIKQKPNVHLCTLRFSMVTTEELQRHSDDCAICWEKMESARKLPCGHIFHKWDMSSAVRLGKIISVWLLALPSRLCFCQCLFVC